MFSRFFPSFVFFPSLRRRRTHQYSDSRPTVRKTQSNTLGVFRLNFGVRNRKCNDSCTDE
jgi:hypothetical protein